MRKLSLSTVTAFLGLVGFVAAADLEVELPKKHFALIESYCLDCHDGETQKGKVNLEALSFKVGTLEEAELWQKVLNAMNSGEMPPENKRQPKNEEKADFLDDLAQTMVLARRKLSDSGGKITMRRLNRREYHNTIESLTGVSLNVESLPSDEGTGTFDTDGASQFISSDQFEQYLRLGRTAIDEAFVRHSTRAKPTKVFRVELEEFVNPKKLEIVKKLEETYQKKWLPWKEGVDKAAKAPENQQIVAELRKKHPNYDTDPVLKYKMAGLLKGAPDPRDYGGSDPINAVAALYSPYRRQHSYMKHYAKLPHNDRGAYLQLSRGIQRFDIHPDPKDVPSGTYKLRIRAGAVKGSDPSRHFIEIGHPQKLNGTSPGFTKLLSMQQISGTIENPEIIEVNVEFGERTPRAIGIQERQPKSAKLVREEFDRHKQKNGYGTPPAIWVDWMELEGPIKETAGQTFRVEPETTVNVQSAKNMKQMEETYERYLGWKAGVDKVTLAPENQKALEQIRKKYNLTDLTDNIRLYQNANLLKGVPDPKKFGFKDANDASFSYRGGYERKYAYLKHYAELPLSDRGTYLKLGWGIQRIDVTPPKDKLVPGTYKLRIRAGSVKGSDPKRHFIQIGHPQRLNGVMAGFVGKPISGHQVNGTTENPEIIETSVKIGADTPREFGVQERQPEDRNLHRKEFFRIKQENGYGYPPAVWVDWIELEGPIQENQVSESTVTRVEPEKTINPANEKIIKQTKERQERFKQWKKAVDEVSKTAENQAIIAEIRKTDRLIDHPNRFYTYADRLKGTPNPKDFGFIDSKKAAASDPSRSKNLALHKHYASLPHRDTGTYLKLTLGTGRVIVAPKKMPVGSYVLRVRVGTVKGTPAARRFIEIGHPQRVIASRDWGLEGRSISAHQVTGTIEEPQIIEIPIEVNSDTIREFAVQEKQPNTGKLKVLWDEHNKLKKENGYGHPPAIWIDWVELEGPIQKKQVPQSSITRVEPEKTINPRNERAIKELEDAWERFARWKKGVDEAAKTPENQALIAEIGKKEPHILHPLRFYRFAHRLKGTPDARDFGFEAAHAPTKANPEWPNLHAYLKHYASLPHRDTGAYLKPTKGTGRVIVSPEKLPMGNYTLRVRVGVVEGSDPSRHFIQVGHPQRMYSGIEFDNGFNGRAISTHQISGTIKEPQIIEVPIEVRSGTIREFAVQEKQPNNGKPKALWETYNILKKKNGYGIPPAIWVDWVELEGPLPEAGTKAGLARILTDNLTGPKKSESERARKIFSEFSLTAFRQVKPAPKFVDQLLALFKTRRAAGEPFEVAIRTPLSVILASPGFLYLHEPSAEKQRRTLTDRELAVRLAYFLWSAPPDAELLALAEKNALHKPAALRQQVSRLLADARSDEFVSGFVHQWLHMERLDFFQFDTKLHREFDESVRASARREVYESFAHLLRDPESGRLGKLLKSDYVFINGLLANYYGIEGVTGEEFRKVKLPVGSPRGGLLGTAAIHAMGSDGVESSPVERGAWVLRYLLNDPSPPAPPNVPQLSRLADKPLTVREKLSAHQEEAQCTSCHRKIDPIGFGLENFDAAGKWRTTGVNRTKAGRNWKTNKTWEIDASGAFYKGPTFADYFELRDRVAEREPDFARGFTEAIISYSLGRPFGFTDEELAQEILAAAKSKQYSVSEFIKTLVSSEKFRRK